MTEIELKPDPLRPGRFVPREMEQGRSHLHWRVSSKSHVWRPPTDVFITDGEVIVRVEIAGMRDAEISISLDGHYLSIQGVRPDQPDKRAYHQMEIQFGEFVSEVELHWPIVAEAVKAEYSDGFLRVILPKAKPQQVEVK